MALLYLASNLHWTDEGESAAVTHVPVLVNDWLHYIETLYSGLSQSNFKVHYGDATKGQCLGTTAEINAFSASGEML